MVLYHPKVKFFENKKGKAEYYFLHAHLPVPSEQMLGYFERVPLEQTKHNDSRFFYYSLLIWRRNTTDNGALHI